MGPNRTTHPHLEQTSRAKDNILTTPAETQAKPAHTGYASPVLHDLTKPTGTTILKPNAANLATLAKQEKVVTPAHAVYLTPAGTLINAEKAIIDVARKFDGYSLNSQHIEGAHKARVFKSALGYDALNSDSLVKQIREGVQRNLATPGKITAFGTQFGVDIAVTGPAGSATVRTGWNYDPGSDVPRLTTAMVRK